MGLPRMCKKVWEFNGNIRVKAYVGVSGLGTLVHMDYKSWFPLPFRPRYNTIMGNNCLICQQKINFAYLLTGENLDSTMEL